MFTRRVRLDDGLYMSVEQLLALPELRGARLLTVPVGGTSGRIRSASVQEVPLQDFVRPGELVMTTGIGQRSHDQLVQLVVAVADADAAALAIAVGPHVPSIPEVVVDIADEANLPLIELPWELRFSEVTELVLRHVLDRQGTLLRKSEEIHELFTAIVLGGGDLRGLCGSIELLLGRGVRIEDRWGDSYSAANERGSPGNTDGAGRTSTAIPIVAESQRVGTLYLATGNEALSELELRVARHAATAAALIILMQQALADGEARGRGELLAQMIHGRGGPPADVGRRIRDLGLDPLGRFGLAVLAFRATTEMSNTAFEGAVRGALARSITALRAPALHSWQEREAAVMVELSAGGVRAYAGRLVEHVSVLLQPIGIDTTAGVGPDSAPLHEVSSAYNEARVACRLASSTRPRGGVVAYGDFAVHSALYASGQATGDGPGLMAIESHYLRPLLDYEARTGLPLTETLAALFAANGNVSGTARILNINRQSLVYRLERIHSLVGLDPTEAYGRFALELALRSWSIRNGRWLDLPQEPR